MDKAGYVFGGSLGFSEYSPDYAHDSWAGEYVFDRQSFEYKRRLEEAGNKAEFVMVPGQGHGFFQGQIYYDKVIEFFEKNIAGR